MLASVTKNPQHAVAPPYSDNVTTERTEGTHVFCPAYTSKHQMACAFRSYVPHVCVGCGNTLSVRTLQAYAPHGAERWTRSAITQRRKMSLERERDLFELFTRLRPNLEFTSRVSHSPPLAFTRVDVLLQLFVGNLSRINEQKCTRCDCCLLLIITFIKTFF